MKDIDVSRRTEQKKSVEQKVSTYLVHDNKQVFLYIPFSKEDGVEYHRLLQCEDGKFRYDGRCQSLEGSFREITVEKSVVGSLIGQINTLTDLIDSGLEGEETIFKANPVVHAAIDSCSHEILGSYFEKLRRERIN